MLDIIFCYFKKLVRTVIYLLFVYFVSTTIVIIINYYFVNIDLNNEFSIYCIIAYYFIFFAFDLFLINKKKTFSLTKFIMGFFLYPYFLLYSLVSNFFHKQTQNVKFNFDSICLNNTHMKLKDVNVIMRSKYGEKNVIRLELRLTDQGTCLYPRQIDLEHYKQINSRLEHPLEVFWEKTFPFFLLFTNLFILYIYAERNIQIENNIIINSILYLFPLFILAFFILTITNLIFDLIIDLKFVVYLYKIVIRNKNMRHFISEIGYFEKIYIFIENIIYYLRGIYFLSAMTSSNIIEYQISDLYD